MIAYCACQTSLVFISLLSMHHSIVEPVPGRTLALPSYIGVPQMLKPRKWLDFFSLSRGKINVLFFETPCQSTEIVARLCESKNASRMHLIHIKMLLEVELNRSVLGPHSSYGLYMLYEMAHFPPTYARTVKPICSQASRQTGNLYWEKFQNYFS